MDALLDRYFARVGYGGPTERTVATLDAIALAHVCAIPFENVDVWVGRGVRLEPEVVARKLLEGRRGGYCFEQNGLLLEVLGRLGFEVAPLSARVRIHRPRDVVPPRTHLFACVTLPGGRWLVDVGVGALSPTAAIRWVADAVQETPHEARRLVSEGGRWFHQARFDDGWHDVCEFTGEEMPPIDREVANWFTSTHPASHFRDRLLAARATPDGGRRTLLGRDYRVRGPAGEVAVTRIASEPALRAILTEAFGLALPDDLAVPLPP